MSNYIATDTDLTAVAQAIRIKGGSSSPLRFPDGFVSAIGAIPTGSVPEPVKPVVFIDSYGDIVHAYTAAEFAALDALPANPPCPGLIAQGWNWTLADAKAYVAQFGRLCIGQMYITDDGKTRIYIRLEQGRTSPYIGFALDGTAAVDWGDGSETETVTGTSSSTVISRQHIYAAPGDYVVAVQVTSGTLTLMGSASYGTQVVWNNVANSIPNRVYQNVLRRVELGADTKLGNSVFYNCYSLRSITMPQGLTSIGGSTFFNCYKLQSCVFPHGMTSLGGGVFTSCYSLTFVSIPKSVTSIGNSLFSNCYSFASGTIPDTLTALGNSMFFNCYPLASITVPAGVTSLGIQAFQGCNGLAILRFLSATPPEASNANTFSGIPEDCVIRVPHGKMSDYTSASNYPSSSTYTYVEDPA